MEKSAAQGGAAGQYGCIQRRCAEARQWRKCNREKGFGTPLKGDQQQTDHEKTQFVNRRGRPVLRLEAAIGDVNEKQQSHQHNQQEKDQFGVSGAHGDGSGVDGGEFHSHRTISGL